MTRWDIAYVVNMALAALITYWIMTGPVVLMFGRSTTEIGTLWAVISTVFVYRDTRGHSVMAGISRLFATGLSCVLCFVYLLVFPSTGVGMAAMIAIASAIAMALGRRDDVIVVAITCAVILIVAAFDRHDALLQPILRLFDTFVGVVVGVIWKSIAAVVYARATGEPLR